MGAVTLKNTLMVIQNTINSVDNRLTSHGEQVGYICLRMGSSMGYSEDQLLTLCTLAMIHDVGAYKVEERTRMTEFEVDRPHEHAVYGSLFVRYFSPFAHMANAILYHHWKHEHRRKAVDDRLVPAEALLIHLADRVSVLNFHSGPHLAQAIRTHIAEAAGGVFDPDQVAVLMELIEQTDIIDRLLDGSYLAEFYEYLDRAPVTSEETISHLSMLTFAMEFRSRQTVTHSASVAACAVLIAGLMGMSEEEKDMLRHAALLHDVGKITTPLEILTKPGRLTDSEREIMRRHVVSSAEILSAADLGRVMEIAVSHHERLNGTGYPRGLTASELCTSSRILAVADVLTALTEPRYYKPRMEKEEVLGILDRTVQAGELDPDIVGVVQDHYERIAGEMEGQRELMIALYDKITLEYTTTLKQIDALLDDGAIRAINLPVAA